MGEEEIEIKSTSILPKEILEAEQWYLDNTKTNAQNGGGFNIARNAIASFTGMKHTEETKDKMRGKNNPNYGKILTKEEIKRLRKPQMGEKHHSSRLTATDVRFARFLRKAWSISYPKLGRYFGVDQTTIYAAINKRTWKHIGDKND